MCLDIFSKFSCTPSHNSQFTLWKTEKCSSAISKSGYQIKNIFCPAADRNTYVDMRTDNKDKLCPACARASTEQSNREIEIARENLRKQRQSAEEMKCKRDARQQEELAEKDQHQGGRKVVRKEGLRKQNAPIRIEPSARIDSPSEAVARRWVRRELDMREKCERRKEGYGSLTGKLSQMGQPSQAKHTSQTDLPRKIENARQARSNDTKKNQHRSPPPDTNQQINSEKENENASDKIQLQLEREYHAEVISSMKTRVLESRGHLSENTT
ncbi:hypothetical protein EAF00_000068 [Botryotinia globosa]|nr:hypothetical protein EAF00_000068 [Botryotinia globosa]